ncbi:MAG: ribosomal L7Ae/L30e/S12e/Gadd45 family protein [Ruminococcus sp.]|nr:ribosomal L7Ae/L30e/S12e/Gadd45 family protein [Ruminococcus sp.]
MSSKAGLISMCRKAGRLVMGMDMVKDACKTGTAKAVFTAKDFSVKSLKEVKFVCHRYGVKLYALDLTMDEVANSMGKRSGVIAMTDAGFAKSCSKGLEEIIIDENEFYGNKGI